MGVLIFQNITLAFTNNPNDANFLGISIIMDDYHWNYKVLQKSTFRIIFQSVHKLLLFDSIGWTMGTLLKIARQIVWMGNKESWSWLLLHFDFPGGSNGLLYSFSGDPFYAAALGDLAATLFPLGMMGVEHFRNLMGVSGFRGIVGDFSCPDCSIK